MKLAILILAVALAGCVPTQEPGELPTGYTTSLPDSAGMALLQHVLDHHFASAGRSVRTTCATISADEGQPEALSPEIETALIERYEDLAPYQRCQWREGRVVDAVTGDPAVIYQVHDLTCATPTDCTAMAGWIDANLSAEYEQYRVHKQNGAWKFEKTGVAAMA